MVGFAFLKTMKKKILTLPVFIFLVIAILINQNQLLDLS